jgi:hypothetical protein
MEESTILRRGAFRAVSKTQVKDHTAVWRDERRCDDVGYIKVAFILPISYLSVHENFLNVSKIFDGIFKNILIDIIEENISNNHLYISWFYYIFSE